LREGAGEGGREDGGNRQGDQGLGVFIYTPRISNVSADAHMATGIIPAALTFEILEEV
jgi:hypothetical protein